MMMIVDTLLITCMGPPGGGRNAVTARFIRHFNTVSNVEANELELERIFGKIIQWHLKVNDVTYFI